MVDMSDNANKMGSNIADIQNAYQGFAKQNYTMLDNLKLGYGGTKGEMQRLLADATKLTGVKYDINNLSDVYQAIHAIQGKLDITGTTAKEASSTISGSFNSMKAAASDFLGNLALGNNIKGPLTNLVTTTGTFLFGNLLPAIGNVFRALPSVLATIFNEVGPKIGSSLINGLKTAGSAIATAFPNMLSKFNALCSITSKVWTKIKSAITSPITAAKDKVKGIIDKIKSFFPFRIGKLLSGISLPHFSIKKSKKSFGPLGTISYPSGINVSWNAEGAIFTRPAILQGVGEAGPEAVLPIEKLSGIMKRAYPMNEIGNNSGDTYNIYMTVNGAQSPEEWARDFARELKRRTRMRG